MSAPRLLMVSTRFPPEMGGIETHVDEVTRRLAASGEFDVTVLGSALLFFVLGYLLYATFFAAAGAAVSSEQEAQQAAIPVMLPLIASALFAQTVLQNPESGAARFAAWFPLTAPVMMPMRMALVSVSVGEFLAVAGGVLLACVLSLRAAARIYRVGMLMYGKRPTLLEFARWMRAGS